MIALSKDVPSTADLNSAAVPFPLGTAADADQAGVSTSHSGRAPRGPARTRECTRGPLEPRQSPVRWVRLRMMRPKRLVVVVVAFVVVVGLIGFVDGDTKPTETASEAEPNDADDADDGIDHDVGTGREDDLLTGDPPATGGATDRDVPVTADPAPDWPTPTSPSDESFDPPPSGGDTADMTDTVPPHDEVAIAPAPAPPVTPPPAPPPPVPPPPEAETRDGVVNGCNTYGEYCDGNPVYVELPPPDVDYFTWPRIASVDNGVTFTARCWAVGAIYTNYQIDPEDLGPDPYDSNIHFNVLAPNGDWGWIPDVYFVRDEVGRMGLPECSGAS